VIGSFRAGQGGDADPFGHGAGGGLVAHHVEQVRAGPDEGDACIGAGPGEGGVFAEETVAGMDGVDALVPGQGDDALDVEVGGDGPFALADEVGFVRLEPVHAEPVLLGEDGDGGDAEFGGGAEDPDGDFGPVGRHQFSKPSRKRALGHDICMSLPRFRGVRRGCWSGRTAWKRRDESSEVQKTR
jgi:hypothetical protein